MKIHGESPVFGGYSHLIKLLVKATGSGDQLFRPGASPVVRFTCKMKSPALERQVLFLWAMSAMSAYWRLCLYVPSGKLT